MKMKNPHLARTIEWIDLFLEGRLSLTDLWRNLGLIPSVLESSVPSQVRAAIQECANELEIIDETTDAATGRQLAQNVANRLRTLIAEHEPADSERDG
jgi:hypothetical protein